MAGTAWPNVERRGLDSRFESYPIGQAPLPAKVGRGYKLISDQEKTMRGTLIVYACPDTLNLMAKHQKRFYGHRVRLRDRLYAAWLVFTGRADALSWESWPRSDTAGQ